jgi:putative ATP-binding cassette transporter
LRHQLVDDEAKVSDERIREVLRSVKFEPALERVGGLDVERDWRNSLSLGEQQLLAVARLLLRAPHFAFLDNPFTALDGETKAQLCRVLDESGITFLVIADEPVVREYFDVLLELRGEGDWESRACRGSECYSTRPAQPVSAGGPDPGRQ